MGIGLKMRRLLIISTRICNNMFFGHPILVAMVCFCIFLQIYFPFLFSIVVSTSPIMICTTILLGTLLLFGEENVYGNDQKAEEGKTKGTHEISPSLRAFEESSVVFGRNEEFSVERFMHKRKDGIKKLIGEEKASLDNNSNTAQNSGVLCGSMCLNDEGSHDMKLKRQVIKKVERGFDDSEKRRKMQEEIQGIKEVLLRNHYCIIQHLEEENLEVKNKNQFVKDKTTYLGYSQESLWKQLNYDDNGDDDDDDDKDDDDDDDDDNDGDDSSDEDDGEDASNSMSQSSSYSSSGNILPMFDELHPLLNEEPSRLKNISHCGSNSSFGKPYNSNETINWPNDEMMKHIDEVHKNEEDDEKQKQSNVEDEYEVFDNESNENDDEEEEVQGDKEDESKSAIKWTEDDQKNVIDLGTLEIERNQRLESLIAKRIARRNFSMIDERNLIDLDGVDFPNNIPSISTRRNPFDDDDNPGSAPSIFLPRKNPFDITCDSIEQKSHLKENNFRQDFVPSQYREPFFRRHQSFNVGPSFLGVGNIERQDFIWKPYFSLHKTDTQKTSNETFQRQLSETSESKMSSNLETESITSTIEEKKLSEEDLSQETEIIPNMYHGSILVEHGSISSEDIDSFNTNTRVEDNDLHHDKGRVAENINDQESVAKLSGLEETTPVEVNIGEILLRMEAREDEEHISRSTMSSSSEIDDTISETNEESCLEKKHFQNEELSYIREHSPTMDSNKQQSWLHKTVLPTSLHNHHPHLEITKSKKEWSGEEIIVTHKIMLDNITSSTQGSSSTSPKSHEDKSSLGENYFEEAFESLSSEDNLDEDDIKDFKEDIFLELYTSGDLIDKEGSFETQDEQITESRIGSPKFDSLPNDPSLIEIREELIDLVVRSSKDIELKSKKFHAEENSQQDTDSNNTRDQTDIGRHEALEGRCPNGKVTETNTSEDVYSTSKKVLRGMELPEPSNSKDVQEKIVDELENSLKVTAGLQNIKVSSTDGIVVNTKEVEQTNVEEELHWFDSSDSLEERNDKEIDYS